jgi:uncharacterized membrane protein
MVRFGAISQVTSIMFLVSAIAVLIAWLVAGEVMRVLAWRDIGLATAGALLVLYERPSVMRVRGESS